MTDLIRKPDLIHEQCNASVQLDFPSPTASSRLLAKQNLLRSKVDCFYIVKVSVLSFERVLSSEEETLILNTVIRSFFLSMGSMSMKVITGSWPNYSLRSQISTRSRFYCQADLFQPVFTRFQGFPNSDYKTSHTTISCIILRTNLEEIL